MDNVKEAIAAFVKARQDALQAAENEGDALPPVIVVSELEAEDDEG